MNAYEPHDSAFEDAAEADRLDAQEREQLARLNAVVATIVLTAACTLVWHLIGWATA